MTDVLQRNADMAMLALVIWREARGESYQAQLGVANVVLNRVAHPGWWGRDVMGVLFDPWQFSSVTDPKDRQLTKWPITSDPSWKQCLKAAHSALLGLDVNPVPGADSYFDVSIPNPKWAVQSKFVARIGRIKFYNLDGK